MVKPIVFACRQVIAKPAEEICAEIADTARWSEFNGYGILPGIASAAYETRADGMVGSRIRVRNRDGSGHVEEIYAWEAGQQVAMKLYEFTPPLSRLADYFTEEWAFAADPRGTLVTRRFQMFARRPLTRLPLWGISQLFRRAVARHLAEMAAAANGR